MRIALLIYSLEGGGAERVMSLLASEWAQFGHNVRLFSLDDGLKDHYKVNSLVEREFLNIAGTSANLFQGFKNNISRMLKVRKNLKKFEPDIVLSFIDSSNILNLLASFGNNWASVVSERTVPEKREVPLRWKLTRRLFYPFAKGIVVQTKPIQKFYGFCRKSKIEIIENPVTIMNSKTEYRAIGPSDEGIILSVGRLEKVKGFDLLIEAFKLIAKKTSWNLRIVGNGSERNELLRQIRSSHIENRVELIPTTANISAEYNNADLYCLSSRVEGFPNALAEAMASGLPVVSADCPYGPAALIDSGVNGILAKSEDPNDLAEKLWTMISHEKLRIDFGKKAMEIKERLDLHLISKKWIIFFEELIGEHKEVRQSKIA